MVAVVAAVGRQVERDRQALLPGGQVAAVERVGLLGGGEPGVLADRPRLVDVHRRVRPAQVRRDARVGVEEVDAVEVGGGVERRDVDALRRLPDGSPRPAGGLLAAAARAAGGRRRRSRRRRARSPRSPGLIAPPPARRAVVRAGRRARRSRRRRTPSTPAPTSPGRPGQPAPVRAPAPRSAAAAASASLGVDVVAASTGRRPSRRWRRTPRRARRRRRATALDAAGLRTGSRRTRPGPRARRPGRARPGTPSAARRSRRRARPSGRAAPRTPAAQRDARQPAAGRGRAGAGRASTGSRPTIGNSLTPVIGVAPVRERRPRALARVARDPVADQAVVAARRRAAGALDLAGTRPRPRRPARRSATRRTRSRRPGRSPGPRCDSSCRIGWVLRAMRRAKSSGAPSAASNGSTVIASAPPTAGREAGDGGAQHVHPRVAAGHHRRRGHGVLPLRRRAGAATPQLGDPGPEPPRRAQLGDRRELVGGDRVPELQLRGRPRRRTARRRSAPAGRRRRRPASSRAPAAAEAPASWYGQRVDGQRPQRRGTRCGARERASGGGVARCRRSSSPAGAGQQAERVGAEAARSARRPAPALRVDGATAARRRRRTSAPASRTIGARSRKTPSSTVGSAVDRHAALADGQPERGDAVLQVGRARPRWPPRVRVGVTLAHVPAGQRRCPRAWLPRTKGAKPGKPGSAADVVARCTAGGCASPSSSVVDSASSAAAPETSWTPTCAARLRQDAATAHGSRSGNSAARESPSGGTVMGRA